MLIALGALLLVSVLLLCVAGMVEIYYVYFLEYFGGPEWAGKLTGAGLMGLVLFLIGLFICIALGAIS